MEGPSGNAASVAGSQREALDEQSLRRGLEQAAPAVRRFLLGMCGDWESAEDLSQEVLLKAWQKRQAFDGRSQVQTWLFAIARNHWLDHLRRGKTAPRPEPMNDAMYIPSSQAPPQRAAQQGDLKRLVAAALGKLPTEQREALSLRESQGLSFAEVAELTGVSVSTVKSRVRYALLKLSEDLDSLRSEWES